MKKILLYCHDTLGFGHISRMLNLYKVLREDNEVHIIFGGKIPKDHLDNISFSSLLCSVEGIELEYSDLSSEIKEKRREQLSQKVQIFQPDIVLIDYYPFGRLSLHKEIDSFIKKAKLNPATQVYGIMRDVFSGKKCFTPKDFHDFSYRISTHFQCDFQSIIGKDIQAFYSFSMREDIEKSLLSQMLLQYYFSENLLDGIIVFGDKNLYRIEDEFFLEQNYRDKFYYMGYLLPQSYPKDISGKKEYILMSFGGSVFHMKNYLRLLTFLSQLRYPVKCMIPFFRKQEYEKILSHFSSYKHIEFIDFSGEFASYIKDAKFYICAGGYGSMMDIMYYQIPSLIALNFNKDIQINETEDGKRFEILKNRLPLHFFESTITAKDIVTMIESDSTVFDFSSVNTKGALNIISFFNTL